MPLALKKSVKEAKTKVMDGLGREKVTFGLEPKPKQCCNTHFAGSIFSSFSATAGSREAGKFTRNCTMSRPFSNGFR